MSKKAVKKAFTVTEMLLAVAIMSIVAGIMALNLPAVGQYTAKREAERVAVFLQGHISKENIARRGLWFKVNDDSIQVWYGLKAVNTKEQAVSTLNANQGCKYIPSLQYLCYHINKSIISKHVWGSPSWILISDDSTVVTGTGKSKQLYITVKGAGSTTCDVIIGRGL